jgi:HSP20 family protein
MAARWQPFVPLLDQFNQFQSEMNRLFGRTNGGPGWAVYPPVNVWEVGDTVHVEAELPGLAIDDLEITVTGGNELTLKGQRKPADAARETWHRQERRFGNFSRTLTLPFVVDPDKVEATLENGVLLVKLGKHESARPRKIAVKGG